MDYVRYLRAKQSVDDRAINLRVLHDFETSIANYATDSHSNCLRIVEVGGGVGSMFVRLLRRKKAFASHTHVEYTIVDINRDVLLAAQETVLIDARIALNEEPVIPRGSLHRSTNRSFVNPDIASDRGAHRAGKGDKDPIELCRIALTEEITIMLVLGDARTYLARNKRHFDVVIGAAVMDLWELDTTLKTFLASLDPNGLGAYYFPINFNGTTEFYPESSEGAEFDKQIEMEYHRAMGTRKVMGYDTCASHTGRHIIPTLKKLGASLKAVGSSSWIVSADKKQQYTEDEAFFLDCILGFIESSSHHFQHELIRKDSSSLERCLQSRRRQIADGSLVYVAHNIDVFGLL